ncbi:hypothetical protein S40293_01027 [Stachybotrys chartarum IBT 40293]|nr:hypothetical protein S40293_01027 [Stachybotrys chartarum IBT 40293]KFA75276.1 hypothetical protein S40288_00151 [Stachybotrys chartarum IBT 40288]
MSGSLLRCARCVRTTSQAALYGTRPCPPLSIRARLSYTDRRLATTAAAATSRDVPRSLGAQTEVAEGPEVAKEKARLKALKAANLELAHMHDPWQVKERVEKLLAKDRYDDALILSQTASKSMKVVVSWNALIAYKMAKQDMKRAIKLFNEMKKRAQMPNVHTYTIIFNGFAKSQHPKLAVAEALKHYNLFLNDSRLQPNTTHVNAVLNVCGRAGDLESMFLVANSLNESTRAPTAWTYSTILHALRQYAREELKSLPFDQHASNIEKVLGRARGIWAEVMDKWRQGRLVVDEELVCAMGRLLLLATSRDEKRDVLDLLEQTMNIPNLHKSPNVDPFKDEKMQNIAISNVPVALSNSNASYVVPGQNTLALLLTVLASSRLTTIGIKYWNLLVRNYGIIPDKDNWLRLFGMLKVAKASAHAASVIDLVPKEHFDVVMYRIAMETCARDNVNHNAVKNSNIILDNMVKKMQPPDMLTLRYYLRVALISHFQMRAQFREGDEAKAKRQYGEQIKEALDKLWNPYKEAHYHYFKATEATTDKDKGILYNNKRELIALARAMFSAFNKVINEKMLPEQELRAMRPVGAKINREIQKFYSNREEAEPNLRGRREVDDEADVDDQGDVENQPLFKGDTGFTWDTTRPVGRSSREREEGHQQRGGSRVY